MNKSRLKIILIGFATLVIIGFISVWIYSSTFHNANIKIVGNLNININQILDDKNKQIIKTINSTSDLSLQNGDYCASLNDDTKYDSSPVCFTVNDKDISVTIDPDYSTTYLSQLLKSEIININSVINNKYNKIISDYNLKEGELYNKGQWYGTTLTEKVNPRDRGDVYRIILEKINDNWTIVAYPQIVLNKYDYPQVPLPILDDVNKQLGIY